MNTKDQLVRLREQKRIDVEFTTQLLVDLEDKIDRTEKQITMMEDSIIIYHTQRAPTRRVWYVGVRNCRGDRAKALINNFRSDLAEWTAPTRLDKTAQEEILIPRYTDDSNNTCVEDSDIPTTWDGSALLETLYGKQERLLSQYSRLYTAIRNNEVSEILKIICETPYRPFVMKRS